MEFKFKYVNEQQLLKVMHKVQMERMLRQDAADFLMFTPKEKTDECIGMNEERSDTSSEVQSEEEIAKRDVCASITSRPHSESIGQEAKERRLDRINVLILRLRSLRRNILSNLDELMVHSEVVTQKDCCNRYVSEALDESVEARVRNCLCLVIKQEYPFVVNLRRLNVNSLRQDMISHLKALIDCHIIALRMLRIFIRGAPQILKLEKSKQKLNDLLQRLLVLSSACKLFSSEHMDIVGSKDFLMDDVDRKCVNLLASDKKREKLVPKCHDNTHRKGLEKVCVNCGVSTMRSRSAQNNEMHIPMNKFKKLANYVFGAKSKMKDTEKKRKSHPDEDIIFLRNHSRSKENNLRGDKMTADNEDCNPPEELESLVARVNVPSSSRGTSTRDTIATSESSFDFTKEDASNLNDDPEDEGPKTKEESKTQVSIISQHHSHGRTEVYQINHSDEAENPEGEKSNGKHPNEDSTEPYYLIEQQYLNEMPSSQGRSQASDDIIKVSDTAERVSDKVLEECLHRVGCEVDIFVEDFVQKMFALEFT